MCYQSPPAERTRSEWSASRRPYSAPTIPSAAHPLLPPAHRSATCSAVHIITEPHKLHVLRSLQPRHTSAYRCIGTQPK